MLGVTRKCVSGSYEGPAVTRSRYCDVEGGGSSPGEEVSEDEEGLECSLPVAVVAIVDREMWI